MQPEEFRTWHDVAYSQLDIAATRLVEVVRTSRVIHAWAFVAATADAAEYLPKGMICRHTGRSPSRTYAVDVPARELPEPWRSEAAALNGKRKKHHVALHKTAMPSSCRHTGVRAIRMLKLMVSEIVDARRDPILAAMAEDVAGILLRSLRYWHESLHVTADEAAIRDTVMLKNEDIVLSAAIAQRGPFAAACTAAAAELEQMLEIRAEGP